VPYTSTTGQVLAAYENLAVFSLRDGALETLIEIAAVLDEAEALPLDGSGSWSAALPATGCSDRWKGLT